MKKGLFLRPRKSSTPDFQLVRAQCGKQRAKKKIKIKKRVVFRAVP